MVQQLISNFIIILFGVGGLRAKIFIDLKLFMLNEKNSQLQADLIQSEKLASLGTIAAIIAHELNNAMHYSSGLVKGVIDIFSNTAIIDEALERKFLGI